jgi:hypothetical protein
MSFKEFVVQDLQAFINADEFATAHNIDGRTLNVIVDNDRLIQRSKKEFDGITVGELLYFVEVSAFGSERPKPRNSQNFDKRLMYVFDVREYDGIYEIILSQNRGE